MKDLSHYSDEELFAIIRGEDPPKPKRDLSEYSDEELREIAYGKPSLISRGLSYAKEAVELGTLPGDLPVGIGEPPERIRRGVSAVGRGAAEALRRGTIPGDLGIQDEEDFQNWYRGWAEKTGISPDPDDPRHQYDYRAAHKAGVAPKMTEHGDMRWPDEFKKPGHPVPPADEGEWDITPPEGLSKEDIDNTLIAFQQQKELGVSNDVLLQTLESEGWTINKNIPGRIPEPPAPSPTGDVPPAMAPPGVEDLPTAEEMKALGKEAFVEPAKDIEIGYRNWAAGMYNTLANIPGLMDRAADKISKATGMPKGGAFKTAETFLRGAAYNIAPSAEQIEGRDSLVSMLNQAVGQTPGTILEYALPSKYLGNVAGMAVTDALREADKSEVDVAVGAVRGATLGKILSGIHPLTRPARAGAMATAFGVPTAVSTGDVKETTVSALTGVGLGMMGQPGRVTTGDLVRRGLEGVARRNIRGKIDYLTTAEAVRGMEAKIREEKVPPEKPAEKPPEKPAPKPPKEVAPPKPEVKPEPPVEAPAPPKERREKPRKGRSAFPEAKVPDLETLESDLEIARESLVFREKDLSDAIVKRVGVRDLMPYQDAVEQAKESVEALLKRKAELEAAPPKEIPPAAAPEPVQTPVSEVVEEGVKGAKLEGIPIPQMKRYLLDKLDDAIKEKKAGTSEGETVEIVIPGDGDFTVHNTPEALKAFRDRVQKKFPTKAEIPPKPKGEKYPPVSKGGKRPTPSIGAVNVAGPYVTDGHFALFAKKSQLKIRPSEREVDAREAEITQKAVEEAIPKLKDTVPTSKTEFLYSEAGDIEALGIADFPIAVTEKGARNVVRLISQKGTETYIDQKYYVATKDAYPDAEFQINKTDPELGVVGIVRKGDVIGAVMPVRTEGVFKEVREGKFPPTEAPEPPVSPQRDIEQLAELQYDDAMAWLRKDMEKEPEGTFSDDHLESVLPRELGFDVDDAQGEGVAKRIVEMMKAKMEITPVGASKLGERFYRLRKEGDRVVRPGKIIPSESELFYKDLDKLETDLRKKGAGSMDDIGYKIITRAKGTDDVYAVERIVEGDRQTIVGMKGRTFESREEAIGWAKQDAKERIGVPEEEVLEARGPGVRPEPGFRAEEPVSDPVAEGKAYETGTPEDIVTDITRRSDIERMLSEKFDVPIRHGRFRQKALGIFKVKPEVIRTRLANDIRTAAHEIGHALNKFLWPTRRKGLSIRTFNEFQDELRPIATGGHPLKEGFAEFIARYVTDEADARRVAPKFYAFFEAELEVKSPESRQILLEARKMYDLYIKQSPESRILSMISYGETAKKGDTFQSLYTSLVHDLYPLERIVREMAEGEKLPPDMDPHVLARMMAGNEGRGDVFVNHKTMEFKTYKFVGKGLREILDKVGRDWKLLDAYLLTSRHGEITRRGMETGLEKADADYIIEKYRGRFEPIRKDLEKWQDSGLRYMLDGEVIRPNDYIRMKRANRDFTPYHRVADYMNQKGGKGKGFEVSRSPLKRIRGGAGDYVSPLETMIKNMYLYVNAAERNAVGKALVRLAESKHGMGKYVEKIPADRRPAAAMSEKELKSTLEKYGKWTETQEFRDVSRTIRETVTERPRGEGEPDIPRDERLLTERAMEALTSRGWSEAEARQILDRIKGAKEGEARDRVIEKEVTRTVVESTVRTFGIEIPDGVHLIWRDSPFKPPGDVISVMNKGDPEFYQVHPDIYRTFLALDKESVSTLMRIMGAPTRLLRAGATLSFEFMARNPLRDQITAYVFSRYGYKPGIDFFRGIYSVFKQDDSYWKWKASGAEQAAFVSMDRAKQQQTLEDVLRANKGLPGMKEISKHVIRHPVDALRALSELGEEGTRVGEFRKGLKAEGATRAGIITSGLASREVTLDFRRIGLQGRAVNQLIAFWNANVQGLDKTMRELKNEPGKVLPRIAAGITLPSVLLAIANQDDKRVRRLPAWEKWIFFHIPVGDTILRLPKAPLLGTIFGTIPHTIVWSIMDDKEADYEEMVKEIFSAISPGWVPTPMSPFVENYANRSLFIDRPLVPRGKQGMLNWYQYSPYTSEIAKKLGFMLGQIPIVGETQLANPAKIENIVRGWSGNLGLMLLRTANESLKIAGVTPEKVPEPEKTLSDITLIRGFVSRYPSFGMEPINKFYRDYEKASQVIATAKMLVKERDIAEARRVFKPSEALKLEAVKKGLSNARAFIDAVYAHPKMDPKEKRQQIDRALIAMAIMAERGNELIYRARKALEKVQERK